MAAHLKGAQASRGKPSAAEAPCGEEGAASTTCEALGSAVPTWDPGGLLLFFHQWPGDVSKQLLTSGKASQSCSVTIPCAGCWLGASSNPQHPARETFPSTPGKLLHPEARAGSGTQPLLALCPPPASRATGKAPRMDLCLPQTEVEPQQLFHALLRRG